jgi:anti-sigma regulatory factor (Ser/Thr protein kinase)
MMKQVLTGMRASRPPDRTDPWGIVFWRLPAGSAHRAEVRARSLVRQALHEAGIAAGDIIEAETVVAELAVNALQHALPPYELRIFYVGGSLPIWCEVIDGGPIVDVIAEHLRTSEDTNLAEGGRGLQIVHGLTDGRCTAYPTGASHLDVLGKAVGFALPLPLPRRDAR